MYTNAAFNDELGITIKWGGERFVIMGNSDLVSDETLLALVGGQSVAGWRPLVNF